MYNRLILFINKHNILTDAWHGFGDDKPNEIASRIFIENTQEPMDKHLYILGLFFYL
jgi:hypothetical protein